MVEVKSTHDEALKAYTIKFVYGKWDWNQVKAIIDLMKVTIPASDRMYEATSKEWTISSKYYVWLEDIMKKAHFTITEVKATANPEDFFYNFTDSTPQVSKDTLATQLVKMLGITPQDLADANLLKKAYRRKALELHPDRNNGDGSQMSELNSVWSAYNA